MHRQRHPAAGRIARLARALVIAGVAAGTPGCPSESAQVDGGASLDAPRKSDGPITGADRSLADRSPGGTDGDRGVASGGCPGRLSPVPTPNPKVVGSGTAASCTEQALRSALDAARAAGGGAITFSCGGKHTITVASRLLVGSAKDKSVIVDGEGAITLSGGGKTRVFDLDNHTNFVVQRLAIVDGFVAAGEPKETNKPQNSGAAIRHPWFGTLKAIDVRFENNVCASLEGEIGGGAIYAGGLTEAVLSGCEFVGNKASNGGGLLNRGSTLTIVECSFRNNRAQSVGDGQFGNGGGVYIDGMNYENPGGTFSMCGAVFDGNSAKTHGSGMFSYYYAGSKAEIRDCVFNGNLFDNGGKGSGALYHEAVPLTLSGTTFSNNTGGEHAGAIFLGQKSEATITNCTFAGNRVSGNGAGLFNGAAIAHFVNCTFSGNDADYGPAIFKGQGATVTLKNTIFSKNTTANKYSATSCHEAMTDQGGNLQWPKTKANSSADQPCAAGIKFADPLLQPLADNGGRSQTFALGAGSPAVNAASGCPPTDQRGLPRSSPCDSGSFEVQP
jgi:predicted outer membrane repeat protein